VAHHPVLDRFSPAVRAWFATSFPEPDATAGAGLAAHRPGEHTLICAPTGSGKTLTAFLASIDRLTTTPPPDAKARTRVLYISPLRALAFDVEKNLRSPLMGIALAAERLGEPFVEPVVAMRTGDTSAKDRQALVRRPPDLLITTPESLYLMLTSSARDTLVNVDTVIIDEIHALAPTKRGAHLALTLERLEEVTVAPPQRIGLSATQRPLEEVAALPRRSRDDGSLRPVVIVDAGIRKPLLEVDVVVPVEDMGDLGGSSAPAPEIRSGPAGSVAPARTSIWPSIYPRILDQILEHRTTIVFTNARRSAERLAARLNEQYHERRLTSGEIEPDAPVAELVKAHHGSLAREQRVVIEDELKRGELRAIVATSSLELGIDMGAVDLVVQVESPGAVSRGAAAHRARRALGRRAEQGHALPQAPWRPARGRGGGAADDRRRHRDHPVPAQPARRARPADRRPRRDHRRRRARRPGSARAPLRVLPRAQRRAARNVLDLLSGRYPSEEFSELRPRLVWDRVNDTLRGREGSRRLAVTSGGTIPDRGLFGVFLPDGTRVGELDEEMVYESRPARRSCSARPRGGSRTSPSSGSPSRRHRASRARCRSGTATGPGRPLELGRGARRVPARDACRSPRRRDAPLQHVRARRARGQQRAALPRRAGGRPPVSCPTTAPWWSSASATRSATGGCASSARSARRCTHRGRWRSSDG
jgi:ATP-dependent Lhr-like helicase